MLLQATVTRPVITSTATTTIARVLVTAANIGAAGGGGRARTNANLAIRTSPSELESCKAAPNGDTWQMGFNPHRTHRRSPFDYVMVAAALVICLGLVLWAVLG